MVNLALVKKVYSGKAGRCCCGCAGTYKYATGHVVQGSKERGYPVTDAEVSDRSVKSVVNKINRAIASGIIPDVDANYVAVEIGTRLYIAYN